MLKTLADYQSEIERVQAALKKTSSKHMRHDYGRYLKRLLREVHDYKRFKAPVKGEEEKV